MVAGSLTLQLIVVTLVSGYVTVPILVLIHEMGHAVAIMRSGKRPTVLIGKRPALFVHHFRSFDLHFHPRLPLDLFYPHTPPARIPKTYLGTCVFDLSGLTVGQLRSIYTSGPHASILAGICFGAVAFLEGSGSAIFWIAAVAAVMAWADGIGNLMPTSEEGRLFSDGARMARLQGFDSDLVVAPSGHTTPLHGPTGTVS